MSYAYGSQYKTYQQAFAAYENMCASGEVTPSEVEGIIKRGKYWYVLLRENGETARTEASKACSEIQAQCPGAVYYRNR